MKSGWFSKLLPRGLYGRAALILILPVVILQIVVSIVIIQRHYDGVTEQMTSNLSLVLRYVIDEVNEAETETAAQEVLAALIVPLSLRANLPAPLDAPPPERDAHDWIDLTAPSVFATFWREIPNLQGVDLLTGSREVRLWVDTDHGMMQLVLDRRRVSAPNPHQLLVIVIATGLVMVIVASIFLRNQLRPIRRLAAAASAFGKGRSVPYRPQGAVEVRAAGAAFLQMRDRLERQIEQRTRMFSAVSHDLRTPITRLKLALALGEHDPEITEAMTRDLEEMEQLVNGFLDYARTAALDDPEMADPVAVVRAAVGNARRAGQEVSLTGATEGFEMPMRPALLARALDNVLGNAVRYGKRAEVSVEIEAEQLRIVIEDDGPGIPPERRKEALLPFIRLDLSRNQDGGAGVGLGLAIVADSVRAHGGRLALEDSGRLGGLKVVITLPR